MAYKKRNKRNRPQPTSLKALEVELKEKPVESRAISSAAIPIKGVERTCGKCGQQARIFRMRAAANAYFGLDEVESRKLYESCRDLSAQTIHLVPK